MALRRCSPARAIASRSPTRSSRRALASWTGSAAIWTISALDRGALDRVERRRDLLEACVADADWVFEAAPEDLELKQSYSREVERAAPRRRNSRLQHFRHSDQPASCPRVERKERALGTHWWNPPYLVPLVEVVRTAETSDAAVAATLALLQERRQGAGRGQEGCPGICRQPPAARALARGDRSGGRRRLRRQDRRRRRKVELRRASGGARAAGKRRSRRHGTDQVDPQLRACPRSTGRRRPRPISIDLIEEGRLGFKSGEGFFDMDARRSRRPCASA